VPASRFEPSTVTAVLEATARGFSNHAAAKEAGISYAALKTWLARGRDGEAPYDSFYIAFKSAELRHAQNRRAALRSSFASFSPAS
jgi:transposase